MTKDEIFAEVTSVYDSYAEALETETFEALQAYPPRSLWGDGVAHNMAATLDGQVYIAGSDTNKIGVAEPSR